MSSERDINRSLGPSNMATAAWWMVPCELASFDRPRYADRAVRYTQKRPDWIYPIVNCFSHGGWGAMSVSVVSLIKPRGHMVTSG